MKNVLKITVIVAGGIACIAGALLAVIYTGEVWGKAKELKEKFFNRINGVDAE